MVCQSCRTEGPVWFVEYDQVIGLLAGFHKKKIKGYLCRSCINTNFFNMTLITALFGWWSLISFFLTPAFIITNIMSFLETRKPTKLIPSSDNPVSMDEINIKLDPFKEEMLNRLFRKEGLSNISYDIGSRVQVNPRYVELYIAKSIFSQKPK